MLKGNIIAAIQTPFSAASGTLCSVQVELPISVGPGGLIYGLDQIDSGQYVIQTGLGVTAGAISLQQLLLSPTSNPNWVPVTTPNSATGAAYTLIATLAASGTYNGSINVAGAIVTPCLGLRLTVSGLTGGSITTAQLNVTVR